VQADLEEFRLIYGIGDRAPLNPYTNIIAQEVALYGAVQLWQAQKVCILSLVRSTAANRERPQRVEQSKQLGTRFQLTHLRASRPGHF
jgi:hypothetical protein